MTDDSGSVATSPRWLRPAEPDPDATTRLLLFHYSGGGASIYSEWPGLLPTDVACQRVQLPGRQERHDESPFTEIAPLVDALSEVLEAELDDRPYALFGHSMGALLAYRVTVTIEQKGLASPALIAMSGWAPVGFTMPTHELIGRSDAEIIDSLRTLGSLPADIYDHRDLLKLVLPTMRADLAVCADYQDDGARVGCPVVSYSGLRDPLLAPDAMRSWAMRSVNYLGNREFPGGHFFIHEQGLAITTDLVRLLRRHAEPPKDG